MRYHKSHSFEGKYYSAQWEQNFKQLKAGNQGYRQTFLSAQWSQEEGWQDISNHPISFQIAHHFTENIKPVLEQHLQHQRAGIER